MNKNMIIELSDYGILPNTNEDYTKHINEIIAHGECNTTYRFAPGTYRFFASNGEKAAYSMSNSEPIPERTLSVWLKNKQNITIDGNGAKFLYYGHVQPVTLDNCQNVTLKHFTIDWEKPLVAEGIVTASTADYIEVSIDQRLFPCFVRNFCLYFDIGDGEVSELTYGAHTLYDAATLTVSHNSADTIMVKNAEQMGENRFRLYTTGILTEDQAPMVGDVLVLRHNQRHHAGIFAQHCCDLHYEDINIHSCGGIGMLFQFCENITCRHLNFLPNRKIGRKISCTRDDGIQISNCRGDFTLEGCSFHGLQDSPLNIHGTSVCLKKKHDEKTIECEFANQYAYNFPHWAKPGHALNLIDRKSMTSLAQVNVSSYSLIDESRFLLTLAEPLPATLFERSKIDIAIENLTNTPTVTIKNNRFGSCRSRGLLVTTPKPVVIEDNLFESAGSAILISGDASFWYESGACRDVIIRRNIFTDACNLAPYQYCYAMISICPLIPKPKKDAPYHSNIIIEDNSFDSPDTPILYAFSVDRLIIRNNRVCHSERIARLDSEKSLFHLKNCCKAVLTGNTLIGDFALNEKKIENSTVSEK
ncbi:MAG: right-handed parallel beta-helix repeat-containing protein [Clostridia bacterium]|nr:right-handed parallel beta-helix repeat-containing protein [Clostridia bacterium]